MRKKRCCYKDKRLDKKKDKVNSIFGPTTESDGSDFQGYIDWLRKKNFWGVSWTFNVDWSGWLAKTFEKIFKKEDKVETKLKLSSCFSWTDIPMLLMYLPVLVWYKIFKKEKR